MTYNGADLIFPHLGIVIENLPNHITVFGYRIAFYGGVCKGHAPAWGGQPINAAQGTTRYLLKT